MFADNPEIMERAIAYVKRPSLGISEQYPQKRRLSTQIRVKGEKNPNAKLNNEIVRNMRSDYATGSFSYTQLGGKYGLHPVSVGRVIRRVEWAHVQ